MVTIGVWMCECIFAGGRRQCRSTSTVKIDILLIHCSFLCSNVIFIKINVYIYIIIHHIFRLMIGKLTNPTCEMYAEHAILPHIQLNRLDLLIVFCIDYQSQLKDMFTGINEKKSNTPTPIIETIRRKERTISCMNFIICHPILIWKLNFEFEWNVASKQINI